MKNYYEVGDIVKFIINYEGKIKSGTGEILAIRDSFLFGKKYIIETNVTRIISGREIKTEECFDVKECNIVSLV